MPEVFSSHQNSKSLADILHEIKDELLSFVETRIRIAHAEFAETSASVKALLALIFFAGIFLASAFLLLTLALVSVIAAALGGNAYRWPLAFLTVAILWAIAGAVIAGAAKSRIRNYEKFPRKTIAVLKADGLWLRDEVKSA